MARSKQEVHNQFSFNDVQNVLEVQLNKLRQQYQSFYPGNIYVLRAIDGDIDDALQNELQEEREKHIEERIILIPYYLSDSYCVGILIQFQTQNKILRAEYFDSVNDSDLVPKEIEKQFAAVYPYTVLQSGEQCKNRNKSVSSALTVKNLLKAVENISLQYATDSHAHSSVQNVLNITETTTSTCEHNLMRSQNTTQHDSMSAITNSGKGNQYKLSDLQTELQRGLEKFSISNVKVISERVRKTEERIKQYEDEDSIEDAEREKVRLSELYRLQSLQDEIDRLTSYVDPENDKNLKIYQLEENLNKGLTTLKITSLEELLQRIQRFEGRVKDYEDEENVEDAEREKGRLKELYRLKGLVDEIRQLKSNPSPENNRELEIRQLEENLNKGLAKLKIMSSEELLQRIRRVESRVRDYEAEGNAEDAEREKVRLNELLQLKDLVDKIAQLNSNCSPENANDLEIRQLKENLSKELTKLRLPNVDGLIQRIHKIDNLIKEYEEEGSMEDAGKKRNELRELQKIKDISDRINELTDSANSILSNVTSELVVLKPSLESSEMCDNIVIDTSGKVVELNIDEMSKEIDVMPDFAGRTILSLLMHFQQKSSAENISAQTEAENEVNSLVQKLKDQLKKEELYFENVKDIVRNLKLNITSNNYSSVEGLLKKLLNIMRPLNVSEIQKLVSKAQEAAGLIRDKDVVLLVGETGVGKSTTIQFLSGAKMEDAPVEISPGKYLDHITAVGPVTNPGLKNVKSAPFSKSETRYIAPVSIQLRDILGSHETGEIILCDAPGFEDTAGPEVDIANSIGVIEALKGTNSVKILALSSFRGLGDRAQGIQKLAHILISMIRGIENKLDSIYYAFTKYPSKTDVNALLLERKLKIDEDSSLQSDTAFTRVLIDMIEKTEETVEKIDPLHDNPKKLLKKIKKMRGIAFPQDVFCFSMSEKSRANIDRHLQRDESGIICAMKYEDIDLVSYYLNDLKILMDLINGSWVRDAYEKSVRFVSETISNDCMTKKEKFNRALASKDGLQKKDIQDYEKFIQYVDRTQVLKHHVKSGLVSSEGLIQDIIFEINKISASLEHSELHSLSVTTHLDNLCLLKRSFLELEKTYECSCQQCEKRLEELVQTTKDLISTNDFKIIAENLLNIKLSTEALKHHLHREFQEVYVDVVKSLLQHLDNFMEKTERILAKIRLNKEDVDAIKGYTEILRSAKENAALQQRVSAYLTMLDNKLEVCDEHNVSEEYLNDLNKIFDTFIKKIRKYFDEIHRKIKEHLQRNGDHVLEHIKSLVNDMDALRTIPEINYITDGIYYQTVESINSYTQQLQALVEELLADVEKQSGIMNFRKLARSLARLKNAEWITELIPGTYESLMDRIKEELIQYVHQLQESFRKIDFSLKHPENVSSAYEIVKKIESMRDLEYSVPELEKYRKDIVDQFSKCIQKVFDSIQITFNLQDKDIYCIKQELKKLQEIERECNNLHPAHVYLQKQGYCDINAVDAEIERLKFDQKVDEEKESAEKRKRESEIKNLDKIIDSYYTLRSSTAGKSMVVRVINAAGVKAPNKTKSVEEFLQESGYSSIQSVHDKTARLKEIDRQASLRIQDQARELDETLQRLELIKQKHDELLSNHQISSEEVTFLKNKGFDTCESLHNAIEQKAKVVAERARSNTQTYYFTDKLDVSTANNALVYIDQCERVGHDLVREYAIDANEKLRKYIQEYGIFLNEEISKKYNHTRNIDISEDPFLYSRDLEMRLEELTSFKMFPSVSEHIKADEKVRHWRQQFRDYYLVLSTQMEDNKATSKMAELQHQLTITQALSCLDIFCIETLGANNFGALYSQYKGLIISECRAAYREVIEWISKEDYAKADLALYKIQDKPLNERDKAQIEHELRNSLNKLMNNTKSIVNWLDGRIEREDNRTQITEIKENIEKIRTACNKRRIMELLDSKTEANVKAFDGNISDYLSEIILRGLRSIEGFMDADSFSEAEQGMETLSKVQRELTGFYTLTEISQKSDELRKRLDRIVHDILNRDDYSDINQYYNNQPKDLLERLNKMASHGNPNFARAHTLILGKIQQAFNKALETARTASLSESNEQISALNYALCFLPEDLQTMFKSRIEELIKFLAKGQSEDKRQLEMLLANIDEDDHAVIKIGHLAERFIKQDMRDLLALLHEQCLQKLYSHRSKVQACLDEQNIGYAIVRVKKILKLEESLRSHIREIKEVRNTVFELLLKKFFSCCETIRNMCSFEQTGPVEKAMVDILTFLEFFNTSDERIKDFFMEKTVQEAKEVFDRFYNYLNENSTSFRVALEELNVLELRNTILLAKKWRKLLQLINECSVNHTLVKNLLEQMRNVLSCQNMINKLEQLIDKLKNQLKVQLFDKETTQFEEDRKKLYSDLMNFINILKNINANFKDILPMSVDIDKIENKIRMDIKQIQDHLLMKASKEELLVVDADDFRMCYNHLLSIRKYIHISDMQIDRTLNEAERIILAKVRVLQQHIEKVISEPTKVAAMLIQIKFFAENISMFDQSINTIVDNILKEFQLSQGSVGISQLSTVLVKHDEGARLISEHSILNAEDIRLRREKMQYQDDLEYILENLTGDEVSKNVLRSRYKTYKQEYDNLLAMFLTSLPKKDKKEPDLEVLVTQTKLFASASDLKSDSLTWTDSFKDDIPKLLAHIFAIWTLKNSQHYNNMRGIKDEEMFLLLPHVGQVIAIFRLLGIGYETVKKMPVIKVTYNRIISDFLRNNLAEVGTGEGKSVVLAVTACIFALTGADVNCSCYSEVLSNRDQSDFASVFRVLRIEDRIKYGTFNKLCEELLNEQCNVREGVRDMIMTNQNTLPPSDKKIRTRPKVLLIDEVDVFLSDKFYGGTYIPSVFLKDPTIKALLDAIWQKKTLKTLNSVKALPAYQNCATKYSNWMFLFDEAIKDMLVALQSYQSSTYIVHNDRIAYVEGESIVDNVVRGYDTVWAYYHEHAKNNISPSSLEENIGILINCGSFSYAEMPHEFAYIGGVTGTLKTLANIEKKILENIYAINRFTYIPSVFGKNNRTYNSYNDVHIVDESEYFMRIRGEIDSMCNAGRSILVFFESEERLTAFFKSKESSSIKADAQQITEKVNPKDRELYVKRAANLGAVTLLTRTFGRGTDFICRNQQLLANGGIHVLQTFFSEELSEEYQIMGRGARQGDRGSYRMILLDKDLEWILGSSWKEQIPKITGDTAYRYLNKVRSDIYECKCGAKGLSIEQCKKDHDKSKNFIDALISANIGKVKEFLIEQNRGPNLVTASSRTVLLMDATGSMSGLLSATKETICTMFERASTILTEKGLPNDAFQIQCVVYRDYDCKQEGVLQSSAWESKASNLRNFMGQVTAMGGGDYEEAIEIGLWHAVQQKEQPEGISQVILIGDAPAKEKPAIQRDRQANGGEAYWSTTKYRKPTYYVEELQKLKVDNIPVHAFYLQAGAQNNFRKIANETSGRCEYLDINSLQGAQLLTNFVTEEVLRKTAGDQGDAAVELYRKKYVKTFT